MECYIDLCPWKGRTSVRWSRNDKKKKRQNGPKTQIDRFTPLQPNRSSFQTYWVPPEFDRERRQSTKWDKNLEHNHRKLADDAMLETAKMDGFFWIFSDHHPKPFQHDHLHHCVILFISNDYSERIKRKHGETVTKIEKRRRTTLTFGRPFPIEGSGLVSLWRFSQNQHKNNGYIRHFKTVVMNVLT